MAGSRVLSGKLTSIAEQAGLPLLLPEDVTAAWAVARPTGFGRARTHSGFRQIAIEAADGWLTTSTESA